jgi:hypothetical protein
MSRTLGASLVTLSWVGVLTGALLSGCEGGGGGELAVYDLEPRAGATAGEQPVRITGANFRQDIGYAVYFGAIRAPQVVILDDTTLLVATPQHDPGAFDVVIAADDGPAYRIVNGFQFTEQGGNVMEHIDSTSGQGEERF